MMLQERDPSAATVSVGRRERLDPSAEITHSILWDDVEVGARAKLSECIVTDRVRVPAGAEYHRMVLRSDETGHKLITSPLDLNGRTS
jgi:NDP-sugar pyrophosphorylase family protein